MTDDLVEKVAQAIYEAGERHSQETFPGRLAPAPPWKEARKDPRYGCYEMAKAAIKVING